MLKVLGIIPARSGSKGLKNKNLLKIGRHSLIEIAVKNAINSKLLNKVVFTSDDKMYINKINKYKIETIHRPKKLSNDQSDIYDVIHHTLDILKKKNQFFSHIVLLQPTTPFRTSTHIDECIKKIKRYKKNTLISVKEPSYPIEWTFEIKKNYINYMLESGKLLRRRQDAKKSFVLPSGLVYIYETKFFESNKFKFPSQETLFCKVDNKLAVNIDTEEDYILANYYNKKYEFI